MKYILSTKQASNILRDKTESFPRWQFFFAHLPTEIMRPKTFFFVVVVVVKDECRLCSNITLQQTRKAD